MRLHPLRKLIILATLLITASMLLAIPVASAQGPARDFGSEAGFLSSLNSQRAAGGLGPLALNGSMTAAADSWALSMATGSFLAHAGDIISGTPSGWTKVGENVGRGQSVTSLTSAFMNSPGHRANIMDTSYTDIGIAVNLAQDGEGERPHTAFLHIATADHDYGMATTLPGDRYRLRTFGVIELLNFLRKTLDAQ